MGFDKSKVYTALNADELKLGSKCVFADTINDLRKYTQDKDVDTYVQRLKCLYGDEYSARFIADDKSLYTYAYLIDEPQYKPFESVDKAMEALRSHGAWVEHKALVSRLLIVGMDDDGCYLGDADYYSFEVLFQDFVFADDGSPCGESVKD